MISEAQIRHIAELAKLKLTEAEIALYQEQLGEILEYFQKLEELDTDDVEPLKHLLETVNVLRDDRPESCLSQEEALRNAPQHRDGFFEVPKVVDVD
ncbi:MAG: Asp-tRNA(Asn)/Glu-tRNA(Gln) amidotransferase subunit GatC [Candidatus Bipolaricaulia bacterium]